MEAPRGRMELERIKPKVQRPNPLSSPAQTVLSRIGYQQYQSIQQEVSPRYTPITPAHPQYPSSNSSSKSSGGNAGGYRRVDGADFARKSSVIPVFAMLLSIVSLGAITYYYAYCARHGVCGPTASTSQSNEIERRTDVYHVFVIRHAERKLAELHECEDMTAPELPPNVGDCFGGDNWCGGLYLVEEGHRRTKCIAKMDFGKLKHIYAQNPGTCETDNVKREYQTVIPLAHDCKLEIDTHFFKGDELALAEDLRSSARRDELCKNGTTVVSWSHTMMPTLLQALGCEEEACMHKVQTFDFDTYFQVVLSCKDSSFVGMAVKTQPCHQPEDDSYTDGDDDEVRSSRE